MNTMHYPGSPELMIALDAERALLCGPVERSPPECSWCGGDCDQRPFKNLLGEVFCGPGHRSASNRALTRIMGETIPQIAARRAKEVGALE